MQQHSEHLMKQQLQTVNFQHINKGREETFQNQRSIKLKYFVRVFSEQVLNFAPLTMMLDIL